MDILTDVMYFCWNKIMQPETQSEQSHQRPLEKSKPIDT